MPNIDKLNFYKKLMENSNFKQVAPEGGIIGYALIKESWLAASPAERQLERRQFLWSGKKVKSLINLDYYEKVISVYDLIIELLNRILSPIKSVDMEIHSTELPLLRIIALLLIEQGYIDEDIIPLHHIPPKYFQDIAKELHDKYPELNLDEFAKKYTDMFETWPEKSKYEIKKS